MKSLCVGLLATALGCSFVTPACAGEKVLHSFGNGTDGANPYPGLTDVNGVLYGTTVKGGTSGKGTVFALDPATGTETVRYSFCSDQDCTDGSEPYGKLIALNGTLYGTTFEGGTADSGAVFALDPETGTETVLYSFCSKENCTDGFEPLAGVIAVKGKLYGTTFAGGASGKGTVFAFDPSTGAETVLYSFCGQHDCSDGNYVIAGLVATNGTLYGTTVEGGARGYGTVFAVDQKTGTETVVHSFGGGDGAGPEAGLIDVRGTLYGTTSTGGTASSGTVFALDPGSGAEMVLYSFCSRQNCADGGEPFAPLVASKGALYGLTFDGGAHGYGTAFALDPATGTETMLYSFCSRQSCTDGEGSDAGLINAGGRLYGTTYSGGAFGAGTVFAVKR